MKNYHAATAQCARIRATGTHAVASSEKCEATHDYTLEGTVY
jgi:hypothetical protein